MTNLCTTTADSQERLRKSKEMVERNAARRERDPDAEKPKAHVEFEAYTDGMEKKVTDLTMKAEKALRQLVDYSN